jgi:pectate lyase
MRWAPTGIAVMASLLGIAPVHAAYEGFGASTLAGDNGTAVHVTTLADSGRGSLRDALSKGNNLRIVFEVSGTIELRNRLEIRGRSFITLDGSTAPDPGITLNGNGLYIRASHDIVVNHIRVRNSVADGIVVWDGSYNIVIDHCSVTNSSDGNIDITEDSRDVTVSRTIIGDTRSNSFSLKSKGMLIASFSKPAVSRVSLHHNLFVNVFQRNPQISSAGLFDIRNNLIRDWGAYGMRIRNGARGNVINNVFATKNNPNKAVILESGAIYMSGNVGPDADVNQSRTASTLFVAAPITTDPAAEVELRVLQTVGAFPRDGVDSLLAQPAASKLVPAVPNASAPPD